MKIIFCNIAWMKYYKGISKTDVPVNGGDWIKKHRDGSEVTNFKPRNSKCYGFVMTRTLNEKDGRFSQIRIEKLDNTIGESAHSLDGVLVVWVAHDIDPWGNTYVIGWYKNATVYRDFQYGIKYYYNFEANMEDVVLLPTSKRHWIVPRAGKKGDSYGFGRSNVWYASESEAGKYTDNLIAKIEKYNGENWINKKAIKLFREASNTHKTF